MKNNNNHTKTQLMTSTGDLVELREEKIRNSLISETSISKENAKKNCS